MGKVDPLQLQARHREIVADMRKVFEKYLRIFDLDIPEIDERAADQLIVAQMRKALDDIENELLS
ncbi:MAG: hypothetical protein PHP85_03315 [Gallionella sp.]|nr:hypothetical protein [Gallionella sp.]